MIAENNIFYEETYQKKSKNRYIVRKTEIQTI